MTESRNERRRRTGENLEDRYLRILQIIAGGTFLLLVVAMVMIDTLGRLYVDKNFHVSDVMFGTSVGALLALIGVTVLKSRQSHTGGHDE